METTIVGKVIVSARIEGVCSGVLQRCARSAKLHSRRFLTMCSSGIAAILLLAILHAPARAATSFYDEPFSVDVIVKMGGRLTRDKTAPDQPVIDANLEDNSFTDSGMEHLGALRELRVVSLKQNRAVSDKGLASMRGLAKLETLNLSGTVISDSGVENLGSLESLRTLDLSNSEITDVGLERLSTLSSLRSLWLTSTKVSESGARKLQEAIPRLKIVRRSDLRPHTGLLRLLLD
jgi:hypothetical protein